MSDGLCDACRKGDHSHHQKRFAGICIGCICSIRPPPVCRYCGGPVGTKGAVHSRCEHEADKLIDEDES